MGIVWCGREGDGGGRCVCDCVFGVVGWGGVGVGLVRTVCMTQMSIHERQPMHLIMGAMSLWT